jgi:hypothetical protein
MAVNAKPTFFYDNLVEDATVSASTADSDYPVINVQDQRPVLRWKGTGSSEQYLEADLGAGSLGEEFADLSAWTETDPNGTLGVSGGKLVYDSGANANDSPDISHDGPLIVAALFAMELVFDITGWATASDQYLVLDVEFSANYKIRLKVDNNGGTPRVTFYRDANAGSWTQVGTYTLSGGTSGRMKFEREASGDVVGSCYDDNDSSYHDLGTYAGGSSYQATTLTSLKIQPVVDTRTADSLTLECATLYHADASGVEAFGTSGHDEHTQGCANVRLDASVGGVGWETVVAAYTPSDDKTYLKFLDDAPFRYYRKVFPTGYTAPPQVGVFYLGGYLEFPTWVSGDLDPDAQRIVREKNRSRDGQFLGSSVKYRDRRIRLAFDHLTEAWVSSYLKTLWETLVGEPFFFAWDYTNHPDEVYYMELEDDDLGAPYRASSRYTSMTLRGPKE